jgi:hypothetical protein
MCDERYRARHTPFLFLFKFTLFKVANYYNLQGKIKVWIAGGPVTPHFNRNMSQSKFSETLQLVYQDSQSQATEASQPRDETIPVGFIMQCLAPHNSEAHYPSWRAQFTAL